MPSGEDRVWAYPAFRELHHRVTRLEGSQNELRRDHDQRADLVDAFMKTLDSRLEGVGKKLDRLLVALVLLFGGLVVDLAIRLIGG